MIIKEYKTLTLNHRPYFLRSDGDEFMVSDKNGELTMFDGQANVLKRIDLQKKMESLDFSSKYKIFFAANEESISIVNYQNEIIKNIEGNYDAVFCYNEHLWAVKVLDDDTMNMEVYSLLNWILIDSIEIEDLFGSSSCLLFSGFNDHSIILWQGGGQDGQCNFIVELRNNKLIIKQFVEYDTLPINPNPNKNRFVVGTDDYLSIYSYPELKRVERYDYPEEFILLNNIFYLDNHRILISCESKIKLYDTRYQTVENIIVKGHEFRETSFYYPTLTDDDCLTSDIDFIEKSGDYLLMACSNNKTDEKEYSILIIDL